MKCSQTFRHRKGTIPRYVESSPCDVRMIKLERQPYDLLRGLFNETEMMYGIDTQIWMDPIKLEIREAPMEISPDHLKLLSALVWIFYDFSNISYAFPS